MTFRRNHLRYFVAVSDEGQISRAAEKLGIAQPALSQAIAELESEVGVELLERNPRGVTPTAAGEALLVKARIAVAAHDEAVDTARMLARGQKQTVELGFVVAAPTLLIVGGEDRDVLDLNVRARACMTCPTDLAVVPGATHLFSEPGTLEQAAGLAASWFKKWLTPPEPRFIG